MPMGWKVKVGRRFYGKEEYRGRQLLRYARRKKKGRKGTTESGTVPCARGLFCPPRLPSVQPLDLSFGVQFLLALPLFHHPLQMFGNNSPSVALLLLSYSSTFASQHPLPPEMSSPF